MTEQAQQVVQTILSELAELPDEKIIEVLDFVRYLRERYGMNVKHYAPRIVNEERWAQLYAESGDEEVQLAEEGLGDYLAGLNREDANAEG